MLVFLTFCILNTNGHTVSLLKCNVRNLLLWLLGLLAVEEELLEHVRLEDEEEGLAGAPPHRQPVRLHSLRGVEHLHTWRQTRGFRYTWLLTRPALDQSGFNMLFAPPQHRVFRAWIKLSTHRIFVCEAVLMLFVSQSVAHAHSTLRCLLWQRL